MKKKLVSWMLFLSLLAMPLMATATVVLYMDISQMTSVSDVVIHARIVNSRVLDDSTKAITTRTEIEAIEVLKGDTWLRNNRLWFDLLGGERDGMQIRVPGTPTFQAGEEVILFLEKNSTDFAVCGLQQGVFRVANTVDGTVVSRDLSGAAYANFRKNGAYEFLHDAPKGVQGLPLEQLKAEIRMHVAEQAGEVQP